jgi:hypothetical protein
MSSGSEEDSVVDSLEEDSVVDSADEEEEQSDSEGGSEDGNDYDDVPEANAEDVVDDLAYDVFNLVACDNHAINLTEADKEELLLSSTTRATQLLMKRYRF